MSAHSWSSSSARSPGLDSYLFRTVIWAGFCRFLHWIVHFRHTRNVWRLEWSLQNLPSLISVLFSSHIQAKNGFCCMLSGPQSFLKRKIVVFCTSNPCAQLQILRKLQVFEVLQKKVTKSIIRHYEDSSGFSPFLKRNLAKHFLNPQIHRYAFGISIFSVLEGCNFTHVQSMRSAPNIKEVTVGWSWR